MKLFGKDPIKEAKRLNALLATNQAKADEAQKALHIAAKAKIEENRLTIVAIEEESLALFDGIKNMPPLPAPGPDQTVNKLFTPETQVPTMKDNFKIIGLIGKSIIGRGNAKLSNSLMKLTENLHK